jgi:hypothetical protein
MNRENDKTFSRDPDERWAHAAADLRSYREEQRRAWGDMDESVVARYLIGASTEDERKRVLQAIRDFPKVRECVEILEEVMDADQDEASALRSQPKPPRLLLKHGTRLMAGIAAGLIIVVGNAAYIRRAIISQSPAERRQSEAPVRLQQGYGKILAVSPDGRLFASGSNGSVQVRDADTGVLQGAPLRPQARVDAVIFSRDGNQILIREGKDVRAWQVASSTLLGALRSDEIGAVERQLDISAMASLLWGTKARSRRGS